MLFLRILILTPSAMKTILVPTDFSEISRNAARYAMAFAAEVNANKIVLYNAYQAPPVLTENTIPAMPVIDIDTIKDISEQGMYSFAQTLQQDCPAGIVLEHRTGFSILAKDVNEICKDVNADLIVMGITGASKIEEVLIGSTAINVMKVTKIPVIIVPAEAKYTAVRNVMLACDFKKVVETTPVEPIKKILDATRAKLYAVNVYESEKELTTAKTAQKDLLQSLLKDYDPSFEFIKSDDFNDAINQYVEAKKIDMIIAIPRKRNFLEGLFKERHTKKLAFHSHVPLMYIHLEDL
jgi:nucleotide-binding universal stress UspA family protein